MQQFHSQQFFSKEIIMDEYKDMTTLEGYL